MSQATEATSGGGELEESREGSGSRSIGDTIVALSVISASLFALASYLYLVFSTPWTTNTYFVLLKAAGAVIVVLLYGSIIFLAYRALLKRKPRSRQ